MLPQWLGGSAADNLQILTADLAFSPAMPLLKHLPFQLQQSPAHLLADAGTFRDGGEITLDVG
jgi:hypothetical protein